MSYKWCVVPKCTNTSIKTPEKLFVTVPKNVKMRKKWLQLAGRDHNIADCSVVFFCEDHFDMQKDMANYYQYKMGYSQRIIMADGALPSKFPCQQDKRFCNISTSLTAIAKRQRLHAIQECENIQPKAIATVQEKEEAVSEGPIALDEVTFDKIIGYCQLEEDMEKLGKNLESIGITTRVSASNRSDRVANCEQPPKPVTMTQSTSREHLQQQCYACNECKETITGFRYACVQCADWDLCGACEARGEHAAHYLLRIPSQRPYKEIQAVLAVIRHGLLSEVLVLPEVAVSVKVKSEPEDPQDVAEPAAESDPLEYSDKYDSVLDINNIPKDSENDHPSPRKRIRSGTSFSRSEQNEPTSPENSSNHTFVHGTSLHHHDDVKPPQNIHARKLPNDNPNLGLIRVPRAHHSTRGITVPTRMVTSQLPLRTRVTKKAAILRRPIVMSSPSGVKATPRRSNQATAITAATAVKRRFLKLPSGTNPADIINSLRSKVTVRLKRIDISSVKLQNRKLPITSRDANASASYVSSVWPAP